MLGRILSNRRYGCCVDPRSFPPCCFTTLVAQTLPPRTREPLRFPSPSSPHPAAPASPHNAQPARSHIAPAQPAAPKRSARPPRRMAPAQWRSAHPAQRQLAISEGARLRLIRGTVRRGTRSVQVACHKPWAEQTRHASFAPDRACARVRKVLRRNAAPHPGARTRRPGDNAQPDAAAPPGRAGSCRQVSGTRAPKTKQMV